MISGDELENDFEQGYKAVKGNLVVFVPRIVRRSSNNPSSRESSVIFRLGNADAYRLLRRTV